MLCLTDCCLKVGQMNGDSALVSGYLVGKDDMKLVQYSLQNISDATNNFHEDNKIGEGGFGPVFKVQKSIF